MASMMCTLVGAIINIILDPIFIFVCDWGIAGAAWATIIGQVASLIISIIYYFRSKTFRLCRESFKLDLQLFGNVVKLGISTFITQMSIVVISLVSNIMLAKYGTLSKYGSDIPIAVIGICMKVFTIIINIVVGVILGAQPILGYNFGAKKYDRVKETYKIVLGVTVIVGIIGTLVFQFCPEVIINMFGSESELYMEFAVLTFKTFLLLVLFTCTIKMSSIFFQAVGEPLKAALVSLIRDIVCFVPLVIILPKFMGIKGILWAAPVADVVGLIVTVILVSLFFKNLGEEKVSSNNKESIKNSKEGVIITISREHGSQGKYIGELVSKKLNIPYYYKEMTALAAKESGLDKEFISKINQTDNLLHELYLTTAPVKYAIEAQEKVIKMIAEKGSCVLVGRAADYVLRDNENLVRIFISAPVEYRKEKVMEMYGDSKTQAARNIKKSDKNRASYYEMISGQQWGKASNYDLCIDSSIGAEETAEIICEYISKISKK